MKLREIEVEGEKFVLMNFSGKTLVCKPVKVFVGYDNTGINPFYSGTGKAVFKDAYLPFKQVLKNTGKYMPHQGSKERNKRLKQLEKT